LKLEPASRNDSAWALSTAWAFVGWRPDDDWLLRLGRLRLPMYLHSESMDVGTTHDMARLPAEMYSIVPTPDFDGASVSRSWVLDDQGQRELTADLYGGKASLTARLNYRDGLPPAVPAGPNFVKVKINAIGLAVMLRQPGLVVRSSFTHTSMQRGDGSRIPTGFAPMSFGPGLDYYQVNDALPGPGVPSAARVRNSLFSLGAEAELGGGWRVASEFVRNLQHDTPFGADATAGYLAVFKRMGAFTPYASVAAQRSRDATFDWYERLTAHPLPAQLPGAAMINAAQRVAAESYWVTSQRSLALGASYAITPQVKLKGEWLHTRIGRVSRMVDPLPGQPTPSNTGVNVLSINLNFAY
jgi:hypothetical protein